MFPELCICKNYFGSCRPVILRNQVLNILTKNRANHHNSSIDSKLYNSGRHQWLTSGDSLLDEFVLLGRLERDGVHAVAPADVPGVEPVDLEAPRRLVLPAEEVRVRDAPCVPVGRVSHTCRQRATASVNLRLNARGLRKTVFALHLPRFRCSRLLKDSGRELIACRVCQPRIACQLFALTPGDSVIHFSTALLRALRVVCAYVRASTSGKLLI